MNSMRNLVVVILFISSLNLYSFNNDFSKISKDSNLVAKRGGMRCMALGSLGYYIKGNNDTLFYGLPEDDTLFYDSGYYYVFTKKYKDGYLFVDSLNNLIIYLIRNNIIIYNTKRNKIILNDYKKCFLAFYNFMNCGFFEPEYNQDKKQLSYYEQNRIFKCRRKKYINF